MQTLQINSTLQSGKYSIKKVLGQGGFGITYLAEHELLGTKVAIKEFFMKELNNRDESTSQVSVGSEGSRELVMKFRDKFIKEARNIARLNHPNIIRIHDVFEENGTAYYVMEYCEGESLNELLKMHPMGLGEAMAVKYIRQVASALQYIHERKMNHLDVKPANIMLNVGNAVLIDFGLSKQYDSTGSQTSTTPVGISHGFAPIEQYKLGGVSEFSPATDIYSLGATLFKLITGQTPPDAQTLIDEDLPMINATASVANAIRQAMQVKRGNRPQSIASWLQLLDSSMQSSFNNELTRTIKPTWQVEEEHSQRECEEVQNYSAISTGSKSVENTNTLDDKSEKNKLNSILSSNEKSKESKIHWNKEKPSHLDLTFHDSIGFIYRCILAGSILTIIWAPIRLINSEDIFSDLALDTIPCIFLGLLGIMGSLGLCKRKSGSVFLCLVYSWLCTISNILNFVFSIFSGNFPSIFGVVWIFYGILLIVKLYTSDDVKNVYPKELRKVSISQWIISIVNLFAQVFIIGIAVFYLAANETKTEAAIPVEQIVKEVNKNCPFQLNEDIILSSFSLQNNYVVFTYQVLENNISAQSVSASMGPESIKAVLASGSSRFIDLFYGMKSSNFGLIIRITGALSGYKEDKVYEPAEIKKWIAEIESNNIDKSAAGFLKATMRETQKALPIQLDEITIMTDCGYDGIFIYYTYSIQESEGIDISLIKESESEIRTSLSNPDDYTTRGLVSKAKEAKAKFRYRYIGDLSGKIVDIIIDSKDL